MHAVYTQVRGPGTLNIREIKTEREVSNLVRGSGLCPSAWMMS